MDWEYPMFHPIFINVGRNFEFLKIFFQYSCNFWNIFGSHLSKLGVPPNFKVFFPQPICVIKPSLDKPLDIEESVPIGTFCHGTWYFRDCCVHCLPNVVGIGNPFDLTDQYWRKAPISIVWVDT